MTETAPPRRGWSALPRWAQLGVVVLAAVILAIATILAVRLVTRIPVISPGVTAADAVVPGSCLAEDDRSLPEYTVVGCGQPHPVQVFATADVGLDDVVYDSSQGVLDAFADEVCKRYLEYRLFLPSDLEKRDYTAWAIVVPTREQYRAGDTEALCVIALEAGGTLTGDLYRPLP